MASSSSLLGQLAAALASRRIRVVDLTQTLTPDFPQIALPPEMGQCWPFRIEEVSSYDARAPGCVIDCSAAATADPDYLLTVEDIERFEAAHGRVPEGAWFLMRTDWSKR